MIPAAFDYHRPQSLDEALRLLAEGHEGTKVINGGQSLLPLLKLRLAEVDRLVDIGRLPELQGIRPGADGGIVLGGAVTYREVLDSGLVAERCRCSSRSSRTSATSRSGTGAPWVAASPTPTRRRTCRPRSLALDATMVLRSLTAKREVPGRRVLPWLVRHGDRIGRAVGGPARPVTAGRGRIGLPPDHAARVRVLDGGRRSGRGAVGGRREPRPGGHHGRG